MTRRTRARIERIETELNDIGNLGIARDKIYHDGFARIEARLSALEDSLQTSEAQIAERKAENIYLNRLLDMLQHGARARGELPGEKAAAEETPK